jgi:hypothetical protein
MLKVAISCLLDWVSRAYSPHPLLEVLSTGFYLSIPSWILFLIMLILWLLFEKWELL